jgi:hypothetical protein
MNSRHALIFTDQRQQSVVKVSRSTKSRGCARRTRRDEGAYSTLCDRVATQSAGMQTRSNAATTLAPGCQARPVAIPHPGRRGSVSVAGFECE